MNECATRMLTKQNAKISLSHVASSVVDVLRVATDGGARELLRVVLDEAPGATGGCAVVGAVDGASQTLFTGSDSGQRAQRLVGWV